MFTIKDVKKIIKETTKEVELDYNKVKKEFKNGILQSDNIFLKEYVIYSGDLEGSSIDGLENTITAFKKEINGIGKHIKLYDSLCRVEDDDYCDEYYFKMSYGFKKLNNNLKDIIKQRVCKKLGKMLFEYAKEKGVPKIIERELQYCYIEKFIGGEVDIVGLCNIIYSNFNLIIKKNNV